MTLPEVLTIEETSEYLRIPLSSLYKLAQGGRIPCQKVGRHWRFRRQTIDEWLAHGAVPKNHFPQPADSPYPAGR